MTNGLDLPRRYREQLETLLREHVPGVEVWAYGSRVNGKGHEASDLDLVLRGPALQPLGDGFFDLLEAIENSNIPILVQAHDWAKLPDSFHREIERDHMVLGQEFRVETEPTQTWREEAFEDVIDFREGPGILAKDFHQRGVPLVRLAGLNSRVSLLEGCDYLDPETVSARWSHFQLELGDILLSTSASLGRVAVVGEEGVGAVPYTGIIRMRPKGNSLYAPFIRYLLEGPAFQQQAEMVGVGSVIRHFGPTHLRQMTVRFPPLPEQRAIAHVLGTLDDKIELNRRMNETLEEMARALFKSWFVDFEPVRAKMEGRWRRGQSLPGLPAEYYDLFPDRLVNTELGEVPEGWEVRKLGEVVEVVGGTTPSTKVIEYWQGGTHCWTTPKDLSNLSTPVLLDTERKITDAGLQQIRSGLQPVGTLLLSSRAPIGYLAISEVPVAVNQGFISIPPGPVLPNLYLLYWCQAHEETIINYANGSTFLEISKSNFRQLLLIMPDMSTLNAYHKIASSLHGRIVTNERDSRALAAQRDTLLPRLMGETLAILDGQVIGTVK